MLPGLRFGNLTLLLLQKCRLEKFAGTYLRHFLPPLQGRQKVMEVHTFGGPKEPTESLRPLNVSSKKKGKTVKLATIRRYLLLYGYSFGVRTLTANEVTRNWLVLTFCLSNKPNTSTVTSIVRLSGEQSNEWTVINWKLFNRSVRSAKRCNRCSTGFQV